MQVTRTKAGSYEIRANGTVYHVFKFTSDYGDIQWMADKGDEPCWAQMDTLTQIKQAIAADAAES